MSENAHLPAGYAERLEALDTKSAKTDAGATVASVGAFDENHATGFKGVLDRG